MLITTEDIKSTVSQALADLKNEPKTEELQNRLKAVEKIQNEINTNITYLSQRVAHLEHLREKTENSYDVLKKGRDVGVFIISLPQWKAVVSHMGIFRLPRQFCAELKT